MTAPGTSPASPAILVVDDDVDTCRNLCLQISGTAPAVGFQGLGRMALGVAEALSKTRNVPGSIHAIRALVAACERARATAA